MASAPSTGADAEMAAEAAAEAGAPPTAADGAPALTGGMLLLATMVLYVVYSWLVGAGRLRLG